MVRTALFCMLFPVGGLLAVAQSTDRGIKIVTTSPDERRLALVVGNLDYQFTKKLKNPANDAQDMTAALQRLGFSVTTLVNLDFRAMIGAINRFVAGLRPSDVVVFYYSGHGIGYNGKNYLLPVDANIHCIEEIDEQGVSLGRLLSVVETKQVRNSFVFLDACRNLPKLQTCREQNRDLSNQGFVRPANNPNGSMIVYATREGATADDNVTDRNGLFTSELIKHLTTPDLGIRQILDLTKRGVESRSSRRQSPARYDELDGDFVFVQTVATPEPSKPSAVQQFLDLPFADLVYVEGGTFTMGDSRGEGGKYEKPAHQVKVSSFLMGKYEVTQQQWASVMGNNPSYYMGCHDCPVEGVSWEDVQRFLQQLNARTGGDYRLPTEAEWEYAAGGGGVAKRSRFGNGVDILDPKQANFNGSARYKESYSIMGENRGKPMRVGSFLPNALGLYDMSGNVWEWCLDWWGVYSSVLQRNPVGPITGLTRVLRGGSWNRGPQNCRVADRSDSAPTYRRSNVGFRVVSQIQ